MSGSVRVLLFPDGSMRYDVNLPKGQRCAEVDLELRAFAALCGYRLVRELEVPPPAQREGEAVAEQAPALVGEDP